MIVEQSNGIVVVEAALNEARAEALIAYIRRGLSGQADPLRDREPPPRRPLRRRASVPGAGGKLVVHQAAARLFQGIPGNRNSRLLTDRLDGTNADATILPVPDGGSVSLADPVRPVVVLPERTTHTTSTILVWVPTEGVLFVNGDTYTPGAPPGPGARSLEATIEANGVRPQFLAGGQGGVARYAPSARRSACRPRRPGCAHALARKPRTAGFRRSATRAAGDHEASSPQMFCGHDQPSPSRPVITSARAIGRWGGSTRGRCKEGAAPASEPLHG